ncbi:MAG: hypothetical protein J6252_06430 [Clostridia bacterium]|nr:hypothetical protein [Clostridia bacterium]
MKNRFLSAVSLAVLFCFAALCLAACQKHIPPAEHPGIRCGGTALQVYSLEESECAAPGCSIPRAVSAHFDKMPVNEVSSGEITLFPGSEYNTAYSIEFIGVYNASGEDVAEVPAGADGVHTAIPIPAGEYAVCAKSTAVNGSGAAVRYVFARVKFSPRENTLSEAG